MENIIKISDIVVCAAVVARGNIQKIVHEIRKAQMALVQETKASDWMKAMTLTRK